MRLADLLPSGLDVQTAGCLDIPIEQLAYDSRQVRPGAVFFALPGTKTDGTAFIDHALRGGAAALVVAHDSYPAVQRRLSGYARPLGLIGCAAPRRLLGLMADRFYGQPSARLSLVGVTGTSGKTTTTYLLEAIWLAMGWSPGVIGTVNYRYQGRQQPAPFTTPEAVELQSLLATMADAGVDHAVMEVSSHALVQERVRGCQWNGAVFTNLGRDHLDFHADLDDYFAAKVRLFRSGLADSPKAERFAAVNVDDPWGQKLAGYRLPGRLITYGCRADALVSVSAREHSLGGLRGVLRLEGRPVAFSSALIGEPHLYNIVAAAATAHALGVPAETIAAGIAACPRVPGRLERLNVGQAFEVIVDYAHKPDAIDKTLRSVRSLTPKRLLTVFGCGGDRDRGKRPLMGQAAGRLSDLVILTSDNPRSEDPQRILADAERGLVEAGLQRLDEPSALAAARRGYVILADRRVAIRAALDGARPGDVVVIAGKGHEDYQIIGTRKHHFDDREEVRHYFSAREVG